jgi:hypothetical protein
MGHSALVVIPILRLHAWHGTNIHKVISRNGCRGQIGDIFLLTDHVQFSGLSSQQTSLSDHKKTTRGSVQGWFLLAMRRSPAWEWAFAEEYWIPWLLFLSLFLACLFIMYFWQFTPFSGAPSQAVGTQHNRSLFNMTRTPGGDPALEMPMAFAQRKAQ